MKTKITLKICTLLILAMFFSSVYCQRDNFEYVEVYCTNKSDETIYVRNVIYRTQTSDTYDYSSIFSEFTKVIQVDSVLAVDGIPVEDGKYTGSTDILKFIVLKESTMKKYSREEIINQRIHDGWYEFTYSELEAMDYTWVYE